MSTQVTVTTPEAGAVISIPSLRVPVDEVRHALAVNLGGAQLSPFMFTRLAIPTGGGTQWVSETLEGERTESVIEGVMVVARNVRSYWRESFGTGDKKPPDCASTDGITGVGDPGGDCQTCPLNQWDSKYNAQGQQVKGKACREGRQIFLLRGDSILPELLQLPPTSLQACTRYMLRLAGAGLPCYAVLTAIALEKTKNAGGIAYSEARFRMVRRLNEAETEEARLRHELYESYMARVEPFVPDEAQP